VIIAGKAAAGPPEQGQFDFFQRINDIHPDLSVSEEAVIDAAAEVFGEVTVDIAVDLRATCVDNGNRKWVLNKNSS
jgi:hypothetical protein